MPDPALRAAVDWLLQRQDAAGWWTAEMETNVTMTAEHLLLLRFLGVDHSAIADGARRHILEKQRQDGSWALYFDGPGDLSTTVEAYTALRLLGLDRSAPPLTRARHFILDQGGLAETRVFTKVWLALFGEYPWDGVPSMPPELIRLPASVPLNIYDFACWARGTLAPLLIVLSRRPVRSLGLNVAELIAPGSEARLHRVPGSGVFWWLDKLQKLYERLPVQPGRDRSRRAIADWVVTHQEADGSWGGIQPPWVYSLIALNLQGMGTDHAVMRLGLRGLGQRFAVEDAHGWRLQACMSPVWDTAWAVLALRAAGLPRAHPAIRSAVAWLLGEQIRAGGDWQVKVPLQECGGWAFEFDNDFYPDVDDTAIVVLALLEGGEGPEVRRAGEMAARWAVAMRSRNGAWGSFDKDNTRRLVYRIPFADFGAMLDPPSEDVTAHVIEMLAALGRRVSDPVVLAGLRYLAREQRGSGSWYGRWGVNHVYGTWCVVSALAALGCGGPHLPRALDWLTGVQNRDGGWGETCHSYEDESFAGVGVSSASQTAWAVMALQRGGRGRSAASRRGLDFLRRRQVNGTWSEPEYTGTGFPRDFYLNYGMYRHLFPTMALAMAGDRREGAGPPAAVAGRPEQERSRPMGHPDRSTHDLTATAPQIGKEE
ncbi:MAG TPA: squalene--hopene cyclase [Candidatus Binatia bacterium]|nr:squalene--hopene cyclase [Candidatus Binatia bacterium]